MKKATFVKFISSALFLLLAIAFLAKFGGPSFLRLYVRLGVGNCQKVPILCFTPDGEISNPPIDKEYARRLLRHRLQNIKIGLPRDFSVIQEEIKKVYYKKAARKFSGPMVHVFYKGPDFFMGLFPQLKTHGIKDDAEFIRRVMYANLRQIRKMDDAFFVIMKGIFIPDLGEQKNVKMVKFRIGDKTGFLNYNFTDAGNFFDCNIITSPALYSKIYIKDIEKKLDLDKVLAILSTLEAD